jgi:integrase
MAPFTKIRVLRVPDFWHISVGVLDSNCTLEVFYLNIWQPQKLPNPKHDVPIDRRTLWCAMQTYGEKAGLPPEKRKYHNLKHSIATHLLDARGELRFVQDWVGHKNVQNTTKYAQLTNPRRDEEAGKLFADHRVV